MFCKACGRLSFVDSEGNITCPCGYAGPASMKVKTREYGEVDLSNAVSRTEASDLKHLTETIDDDDVHHGVLSNGSYYCPKCGCEAVYSYLQQMDQTDEPEVVFLTCKDCRYGWRD